MLYDLPTWRCLADIDSKYIDSRSITTGSTKSKWDNLFQFLLLAFLENNFGAHSSDSSSHRSENSKTLRGKTLVGWCQKSMSKVSVTNKWWLLVSLIMHLVSTENLYCMVKNRLKDLIFELNVRLSLYYEGQRAPKLWQKGKTPKSNFPWPLFSSVCK